MNRSNPFSTFFRIKEQDADGEAKLEEARTEQKIMKCIAIRCHESNAVFAHNVPVKGRDEDNYVAGLIATWGLLF